ncbi:hypothetical protein GWI33_018987 [Rhynchophorus ferrugineus]|uniref:Thyroglobulin type-1 domain-containing protein n=1 Tax=Rhynchophorus ferrugineus TaxID=354439 RepID=A0A834HSC1_RHYFE|nr:hypothetical protein GWI33_018987 [Rhynchophorus ferrugineus]
MSRVLHLCVLYILFRLSREQDCPSTVVTNFHQKNCTDQATTDVAYYLDRSGCIPKCAEYPTVVQDSQCTTNPNICIAGYSCENRCGTKLTLREYPCEVDEDCTSLPGGTRAKCLKYCVMPKINTGVNCMAYHSNLPEFVQSYWTAQKFKPVCDDNSDWVAKQCKGGVNGKCICYSATGVRLFGEALYTKSENMTCACSRRKNDLESSGRTIVTLHCDSMGNYEALQCDMEKEICWCAESKTGALTAPAVPEKAKAKLPCYVSTQVGSQYLRQCESKKFAQLLITAKLKAHGAKYVQADTLLCDADGSYGAYLVSSGIAYCTWRDNSKIGTWQSNIVSNTGGLNCYCARDYKRYEHSMDCQSNGNYENLQHYMDEDQNIKYYCVDNDGFAKTDLFDFSNITCSEYY